MYKGYCTKPKNKLHKAFEDYISVTDRLASQDLASLKKVIKKEVEKLNQKHSRCKPIKIHFADVSNIKNRTIGIYTNTNVTASILQIKTID